jgi:DNA-binding IclR family transcriptional regulator
MIPKDVAPLKRRKRSDAAPDIAGRTDAPGKVVGAVAGAIKILRYLSDTHSPVGVSKIAKETQLNTSTSFNILRTLAMNDFVDFDPLSKTYSLSLGIMEIAKGATALGGEFGLIQPLMERVANTHGITLTLWQPLRRDRKVLIMAAHTRNAMRIQMAVGQILPLLVGSNGRLFAAFGNFSEKEIRKQFDAIRWDGPLTFAAYMAQVAQTKKRGWAIDEGNYAIGTTLISTPIFRRDGQVAMAVTAVMFSGQYNPEKADGIVDDLKTFSEQAARIICA